MVVSAPFTFGSDATSPDVHRIWDFLYVLPSFGPWWLGLLPLLLPRLLAAPPRERRARELALTLTGLGVVTVLLTAIVSWDCFIVHHQSYEAMLVIGFGLCLGIHRARMAYRRIVVALCATYTLFIWIITPLLLPDATLSFSALVGFMTVASVLFVIALPARGRPEDQPAAA